MKLVLHADFSTTARKLSFSCRARASNEPVSQGDIKRSITGFDGLSMCYGVTENMKHLFSFIPSRTFKNTINSETKHVKCLFTKKYFFYI